MEVMDARAFSHKLLAWYAQHGRDLPWRREDVTPYEVWLSEIILQQTRVPQGLPYYRRFVEAYPTITQLAHAEEEEVLRHWQGLGYYTRARNMLRTAQHVVRRLDGKFPRRAAQLQTLPGIGPYTAAAIASMAFQEPVVAIDGNVYRLLSRLFGIEEQITCAKGRKMFGRLAQRLLDRGKPGTFNQALMEFGALCCTPRQPQCHHCPFRATCVAFRCNMQHRLPVKAAKQPVRHRYFHYLVFMNRQGLYLHRRGRKDIWQGLYDFYLVEAAQLLPFGALQDPLVERVKRDGAAVVPYGPCVPHQLTHQRVHAAFFQICGVNVALLKGTQLQCYRPSAIDRLPLPMLIQHFLRREGLGGED